MGRCETCKRYEQMRFYGGDTWYDYCHQASGLVPCDGDGSFTDDTGGKKRCRRLYKPITTTTMDRASDKLGAPKVTPEQWEQRRYEIAKECFANCFHGNMTAAKAVERADQLIRELKKTRT